MLGYFVMVTVLLPLLVNMLQLLSLEPVSVVSSSVSVVDERSGLLSDVLLLSSALPSAFEPLRL